MVNATVTNAGKYQYFVGVALLEDLGSRGDARSAFGGGTCGQFPKVFHGYFLGLRHRLTGKCVVRFCKLQGGLLTLGFLHPIECGGSCGDVVEVVEEAPRGDGKSYGRAKALCLRPKGK